MSEDGRLSPKQSAVMKDLLEGKKTVLEVLKEHNVSKGKYNKWLKSGLFAEEFKFHLSSSRQHTQLMVAKHLPIVINELGKIAKSEKSPETIRKACLGIISIPGKLNFLQPQGQPDNSDEEAYEPLEPEKAAAVLRALVNFDKQKKARAKNEQIPTE